MAKPCLSQQPQGSKESKRPSVPLGRLCPFPPGWCCLGLPRSCLKTSGSGELSEGAGGRNRRVHMLKHWLECLERLAGPQAQGPWPGEGTTPKRFSPVLRSRVRGLREQPARVLANQPLEAAGEVFKRESAGSAQRPHRPKAETSTAPALGEPGPDLPGLHWYCPMLGKAAGGVCRHARAPHRLSPARAFPLGLGLS